MPLKHAWRVDDCAWKEWLPVPLVTLWMLSYRTTAFKCNLPSPPHPLKSSLLNRYNPLCSWSSHCLYWIWDLLTLECSPTITGNRDRKMLFCGAVYKYHTCTYGKIPWNTSFAFNECTAFVAFPSVFVAEFRFSVCGHSCHKRHSLSTLVGWWGTHKPGDHVLTVQWQRPSLSFLPVLIFPCLMAQIPTLLPEVSASDSSPHWSTSINTITGI